MDLREEGGMENWEDSKKGKLCLICDPREKNLFNIQMARAFHFFILFSSCTHLNPYTYIYTHTGINGIHLLCLK